MRKPSEPIDYELHPRSVLILAGTTIVFSLLNIPLGDALFMRLFYGTGEHALRFVNSKQGLLSDGHKIPPLLNSLRVAMDVVPIFVFVIVLAQILFRVQRRWKNSEPAA